MKCHNCGKEFNPSTVVQKYCSAKCRNQYTRSHNMNDENPSITFTCAQCGKVVVTESGTGDRRSRFCSAICERRYWRHPHWEREGTMFNAPGWLLELREKDC